MACSQSDFVKDHVNIIPAPVKDIFENNFDEITNRNTMKLHYSNHTMISCSHFSSCVTIVMKRTVSLSSQLSNGSLNFVIQTS